MISPCDHWERAWNELKYVVEYKKKMTPECSIGEVLEEMERLEERFKT